MCPIDIVKLHVMLTCRAVPSQFGTGNGMQLLVVEL